MSLPGMPVHPSEPFGSRLGATGRNAGYYLLCTATSKKMLQLETAGKKGIAKHLQADLEEALTQLHRPVPGRDKADIPEIIDMLRQTVLDVLTKEPYALHNNEDSLAIARSFNALLIITQMFAAQVRLCSDRADELWREGSMLEDKVKELELPLFKQEQPRVAPPEKKRVTVEVAQLFQDIKKILRNFANVQAKELQEFKNEVQALKEESFQAIKVDSSQPCEPASPPKPAAFPGFTPLTKRPRDENEFDMMLHEVQAFVPVDESMEPAPKRPATPYPQLSPVLCPTALDAEEVASLYEFACS